MTTSPPRNRCMDISWTTIKGRAQTCTPGDNSYLRRIDSCITQLKAQGPSRTCNESKEEDEEGRAQTCKPSATASTRTCRAESGYRGTSLIRNSASLGPYSRTMHRTLWKPWLGGGAVSYERGTPVCRSLTGFSPLNGSVTSTLAVLTKLTFCIRGGREVAINVGCVWFVSWQTEVKTALSIHPPLHFAHSRVPRPSGPMMHWSRAVAPTSSRGGLVLA